MTAVPAHGLLHERAMPLEFIRAEPLTILGLQRQENKIYIYIYIYIYPVYPIEFDLINYEGNRRLS